MQRLVSDERLRPEVERYRALLTINNAIITNLTQSDLLRAICESLTRIVAFDIAAICIYDQLDDSLRMIALEGCLHTRHFEVGQSLDLRDSCAGEAFKNRRAVFRSDLEAEQTYTSERWLLRDGVLSICVVPLIVQGRSIGTLNLASATRDQYSQQDAEFLQEVANQVALAISNMESYEEIKSLSAREAALAERRRLLIEINNAIITNLNKDDLFHTICTVLRRAIPCDKAGLSLYDPELDDMRVLALDGDYSPQNLDIGHLVDRKGEGSGYEWDFRHPIIRHDLETERQYTFESMIYAEGLRSHITLPLIVQGEAIGSIGVGSFKPGQYTETDLQFMQEVANQVALAIANMRAYEEIAALSEKEAATAERRRTLLEINNTVVRNLTRQDLCDAVFAALQRIVPFDRIGLALFDYELDAYRIIAQYGTQSNYFSVGQFIKRQENWNTAEFGIEQPMVIPDLEVIQRTPFEEVLFNEGIRSFCAVPMMVQGSILGALSVVSRTKDQYQKAIVEFLQEAANQVAIAIANMQAYEEIAALKAQLQAENLYLQEEIRQEHNFQEIVGSSPSLIETLARVERVAVTDSTVLILGETGTGKELVARAIHDRSPRRNRPLVKVNCGAISAGLVESELFGHVKGAFTGAVDRRTGRFELADGGTLFLDEVGELPPETQVKLLRVLQEGEFEPVGSSRTVRVDVRVIAATNRNLEDEIRVGRFREDLFYRLNVFPVRVPPLRERLADVPQLVMFFLARFARRFSKRLSSVTQDTIEAMTNHSWPGNIREIQNAIEQAVILAPATAVALSRDMIQLPESNRAAVNGNNPNPKIASPSVSAIGTQETLEDVERQHILAVLEKSDWVIEGTRGAAKILDLHPNTLRSRMKKLGIRRPAQLSLK